MKKKIADVSLSNTSLETQKKKKSQHYTNPTKRNLAKNDRYSEKNVFPFFFYSWKTKKNSILFLPFE